MIGVNRIGRPIDSIRCWVEALRPVMISPAITEVPM